MAASLFEATRQLLGLLIVEFNFLWAMLHVPPGMGLSSELHATTAAHQGGPEKHRLLSSGSRGVCQKAMLFRQNMGDCISEHACHAETSSTKQLSSAWQCVLLHLELSSACRHPEQFCDGTRAQILEKKRACCGAKCCWRGAG